MDEDERIDKLAKAIWNFYYPEGGSIYKTYESTPFHDQELLRAEARKVADYLSGFAVIRNAQCNN